MNLMKKLIWMTSTEKEGMVCLEFDIFNKVLGTNS